MRKIAVSKTSAAAKAARDNAEREGAAAREAGITVGRNPYKSGSAWIGWRVGWFNADGRPDRLRYRRKASLQRRAWRLLRRGPSRESESDDR